jgi:predicted Zn-ribbon and HTH transcriptional regulator
MATHFDLKIWNEKAYKKYERTRPRKGKASMMSLSDAKAELKKDLTHNKKLKKIADWCDTKGINLQFSGKACAFEFDDNTINVNVRCTPETQVYSLLHECGHALIGETNKKFDNGYNTKDPNMLKSLVHRTDVLYEECEAWHRGYKLSQRLGIKLNKKAFDVYKTQCLKTYVKWFVKLSYPDIFKKKQK